MKLLLLTAVGLALPASIVAEEKSVAPFEVEAIEYTGGKYKNEKFRYLLLKPKEVKDGETYPLVLFLHGAGERGDDPAKVLSHFPELMAKADYREKFPCFVIAPQCRNGEQWVNAPWSNVKSTPMAKEPSVMMGMAMAVLDRSLKELPIDKHRVYLTGLSMGGYGSWDLAMRRPELFAAVAPICGGGDETQAKKLAGIPIWVVHGDADRAVPVERSRQMVEAIKAADGKVRYVEYPKVGHNSWATAYRDPEGLLPWMFQQQKPKGR